MKYIFEISHRASVSESAEAIHNSLINFLKETGTPWGINPEIEILFPGYKGGISAIIELKKQLSRNIRCTIMYAHRNALDNHQLSDDSIYYEIDSKKIEYSDLVHNLIPKFIKFFNAYSAKLYPEDLIYEDFEKSRNKNLRECIYRFYPVMYFDKELCNKALKVYPDRIIGMLNPVVIRSEILNEGVYYIASDEIFAVTECNEFDEKVRSLVNNL